MPARKTTSEFTHAAKLIHGERYDYSRVNYISSMKKVSIICRDHGLFYKTPNGHLVGQGCPTCGIELRTKKITMTKTEFIARAMHVHKHCYDYGLVEYTTSLVTVTIVCPKHGAFEQTPAVHLRGHGCKKCANGINGNRLVKTTSEFITNSRNKHGNKYLYENAEYTGHRQKLVITCVTHGDFAQTPDAHLIGGQGCPECAKTNRMLSNRKMTKEDFIKSAIEIHGDLYDYNKVTYINTKTKVQVWCKKHACYFSTVPEIHLRVKCGCPKCGSERTAAGKIKTPEQFVLDAKKLYGDAYDYSSTCYNGYYERITVLCSNRKHGSFEVTAGGHLAGIGCPRCNKNVSKMEEKFLDLIGILPENRQIRIGRYKVDGFDPQTNTIWEFDGDFWHGNPQCYDQTAINPRNKKTYGELYAITLKKRAALEKLGYNVKSIWEFELDKFAKEYLKCAVCS